MSRFGLALHGSLVLPIPHFLTLPIPNINLVLVLLILVIGVPFLFLFLLLPLLPPLTLLLLLPHMHDTVILQSSFQFQQALHKKLHVLDRGTTVLESVVFVHARLHIFYVG